MAEIKDTLVAQPGEAPKLSDNALKVLQSRYLMKDEQGKIIETPAQMFSRVALLAASMEKRYGAEIDEVKLWHRKFYDLMASLIFLSNSPTLMNANRPSGMLSACFVLPIEDSIEGIFETIKQTALIQKAGGGTGFSLDKLRPTGDIVASSGGTTSGPISFWKVFSQATDAIQQGAFRRGANMAMCSVTHPDILKFINAKQEISAFTNFNISVKVTNSWMDKAIKSDKTPHIVANPRTGQKYLLPKKINITNYTLSDLYPIDYKPSKTHKSDGKFYSIADVWKMIISCAHKTGEPGLAFIDRINDDNPIPSLGSIEAANPCGEQPLLPYEACTLGSINLTKFIIQSGDKTVLDYDSLAAAVSLSVRFLDNIIDACKYPVSHTAQLAQSNRKIGLGLMGFADCLFMLGIPYDSQKGVDFGEKLMAFVNEQAHKASSQLADLRGPFPNWSQSIWRTKKNLKLRNASVTTIAPTGTISIIADCSAGIEPLYSLVFTRQVLSGEKLIQVNPIFKRIAEQGGFYSKKLEAQIAKTGIIRDIKQIPKRIRDIFKCTYDIAPDGHIKMQAAFQKYCDSSVSKTVNLPEKASVAAVDKAYKMAYQLGCKGVTVYRRTSRKTEPMALA